MRLHKGISPSKHCDGLTTPCGIWKLGKDFDFTFSNKKVTCKKCKRVLQLKETLEVLLPLNSLWYHPNLNALGIIGVHSRALYPNARFIVYLVESFSYRGICFYTSSHLYVATVKQAHSNGWVKIGKL